MTRRSSTRALRLAFAACCTVAGGVAAQVPQPARVARASVPAPQFQDPQRAAKLRGALPEIERLFDEWVDRQRMPGAAMAVIIDGELALVRTRGLQDVAAKTPVSERTVFRIASMTKSFTALAILKLRDEGKLSLDDPVARYVPELETLAYPTRDAPVLTVRHLLTHSEGFPEDNPWGDRQLAQSDATLGGWLRAGIPFSNVPGLAYEYSNYGFALLGRIVQNVAGVPYDEYLRREILQPLGLASARLDLGAIPAEVRAKAYRRDGTGWADEAPLAHGSFGAMGGLWIDIRDLASYASFHLDAWPPRDDAERGPVRRASVREMQQQWRASPAFALRAAVDLPLGLNAGAYGYGLRITQTCTLTHVGHGGGLPGFGSLMRWLPQHGVGLVAMANLTYASFAGFFDEATSALARTGALQPRVPQPSAELLAAQAGVARLVTAWSDSLANRLAADNLFMDEPAAAWRARLAPLAERHGACTVAPIEAENALRGTWRMPCTRGWLQVSITLAPTRPAQVQYLNVQSVLPPTERMARALASVAGLAGEWDAGTAATLAAPSLDPERLRRQLAIVSLQWGPCEPAEVLGGDGTRESIIRWTCARGLLNVRAVLDPTGARLERLDVAPAREQACAQ